MRALRGIRQSGRRPWPRCQCDLIASSLHPSDTLQGCPQLGRYLLHLGKAGIARNSGTCGTAQSKVRFRGRPFCKAPIKKGSFEVWTYGEPAYMVDSLPKINSRRLVPGPQLTRTPSYSQTRPGVDGSRPRPVLTSTSNSSRTLLGHGYSTRIHASRAITFCVSWS